MKDIIFFDLDGTIVDSAPGIKASVKYALLHFGIDEKREEILNQFIGPPLFDAFSFHYNMDKENADIAVAKYRENYNKNGAIELFSVYDGVEEMLRTLFDAGKRLCVASAKPTPFVERILKKANLDRYFEIINGASFDETKRSKSAVIKETIALSGAEKARIIMVGDRENDITGAKKNGLDSIGVTYGYGDEEELRCAGCTKICHSPAEIIKEIMK